METEAAYKVCPNGHYYQGEECPYCNTQTKPFSDNDIEEPIHDMAKLKVCPNGHAYDKHLGRCPYCG